MRVGAAFAVALAAAWVAAAGEIGPQGISNTAWSLAPLAWLDRPLLDALSAAAQPQIRELAVQDLSNTSWAFAAVAVADVPLRSAIASQAIARCS
mmetsp:Transcript_140056/g.446922  ORF Transcript_140056/g.446922 Transcript_140056/m.446922 type:complete len:95 (-) Transcript_140056:550-834(-)